MPITIQRNLAGEEDLLLGVGTEDQTRDGASVTITKLNADNIPYDGSDSIKDAIDATSGDMTKAVYDTNDDGTVDDSTLLEGTSKANILARANHTGTQTASTISDFDTEVGNNSAVALNTAKDTNVSTDLAYSSDATTSTISSSDGNNAVITAATDSVAGVMVAADKVILDALDTNVEVVQTQLSTKNGFDRSDFNSLGVTEFCVSASGGIVGQYKNVAGVMTYTELTTQTEFAAGTAYATALADRTVVIYPHADGGAEFSFYLAGTKYTETTLHSVAHADTSGTHWFYMDESTHALTTSLTPPSDMIENCAITNIVYYNATYSTEILFANEQHGIAMDGVTHKYLHLNIGALYTSGLGINGLSSNGETYTSTDSGWIADEDISQYMASQTNAPFWYKEGATGVWTSTTASLKLAYDTNGDGSGDTYYNDWSGSAWQLSSYGSANDYSLVHFFTSNDGRYPMVKVVGEEKYLTRATARAGAETEIASLTLAGLPTPEIVKCYSMIVDGDGELQILEDGSLYIDWREAKAAGAGGSGGSTTLHADLTDTDTEGHPASAIVNTPSGNLASTDVQDALNELQTDVDTRIKTADIVDTLVSTSTTTPLSANQGKELQDDKVSSDPSGVTGADQVTNMMSLTQAEYDAIGSPDSSTFYIITD